MRTFWVRVSTGLTVAALFIAAILYSRWSYSVAIMMAVLGGVHEFCTITAPARRQDGAQTIRTRRVALILTFTGVLLSLLLNLRYKFADVAVVFPAILFFYFVRKRCAIRPGRPVPDMVL
jgi:hypothetical protein